MDYKQAGKNILIQLKQEDASKLQLSIADYTLKLVAVEAGETGSEIYAGFKEANETSPSKSISEAGLVLLESIARPNTYKAIHATLIEAMKSANASLDFDTEEDIKSLLVGFTYDGGFSHEG